MARKVKLGLKFDAPNNSMIATKINKLVNKKIRSDFGKLRPNVAKAIDRGVERSKKYFIPDENQIAQLGVGKGGSPDMNRVNNAYKALKTGSEQKITKFSIKKIGSDNDFLVGKVTVDIRKEAFLSKGLTVVPTPDSKHIKEIPWMRWFIQGKTIGGHSFKADFKKLPEAVSRTGLGIMINSGVWDFAPAQPRAFQFLLENIKVAITRTMRGMGGRNVRSFARRVT